MRVPIFTSSWFQPLPPTYLRCGISRAVPRTVGRGYRRLPELQPGPWLDLPVDEFVELYAAQLAALDAAELVQKIQALSAGYEGVALVCWESPIVGAPCHRGQISAWLFDEFGLEIREFGFEGCGCGHRHPLLQYR